MANFIIDSLTSNLHWIVKVVAMLHSGHLLRNCIFKNNLEKEGHRAIKSSGKKMTL